MPKNTDTNEKMTGIERELRLPRGGEAAVIVTALLDLHRTAGTAQGSTIRGKKADGNAARYLEAASALGDQLVDDLIGPAESAAR